MLGLTHRQVDHLRDAPPLVHMPQTPHQLWCTATTNLESGQAVRVIWAAMVKVPMVRV